jgi:hypothetical protein
MEGDQRRRQGHFRSSPTAGSDHAVRNANR